MLTSSEVFNMYYLCPKLFLHMPYFYFLFRACFKWIFSCYRIAKVIIFEDSNFRNCICKIEVCESIFFANSCHYSWAAIYNSRILILRTAVKITKFAKYEVLENNDLAISIRYLPFSPSVFLFCIALKRSYI